MKGKIISFIIIFTILSCRVTNGKDIWSEAFTQFTGLMGKYSDLKVLHTQESNLCKARMEKNQNHGTFKGL